MSVSIRKDFSGIKNLNNKISQLEKISVDVGIFDDSVYSGNESGRGKRPTGHNAGLPVATIAYINENGSYNTPARPFRQQTILAVGRSAVILGNELELALTKSVPKATQQMGKRIKDLMYMIVDSWSLRDSNSDITVSEKGFDKPLEWTGKLLSSIDYRVRVK